jgi:RecA/RadA recombinase
MDLKDIPQGAIVAMYGPPSCGKTWVALDMVGRIHAEDPEAFAVWFDTEFRMGFDDAVADFGVKKDRFVPLSTNTVADIEYNLDKIFTMVEDGLPLKVIVLNTVTGIVVPRDEEEPIGYRTRLLEAMAARCQRHRITLILVCHVRKEMYGFVGTTKMPGGMDVVDYRVSVDGPTGVEITKVEKEAANG